MIALVAVLFACEPPPEAQPGDPYPLDDVLRFDDLQAKGTHNSYHVQTVEIPEWRFTHLPLDAQLGEQGIRQFELDLAWNEEAGRYEVFHIAFVDVLIAHRAGPRATLPPGLDRHCE